MDAVEGHWRIRGSAGAGIRFSGNFGRTPEVVNEANDDCDFTHTGSNNAVGCLE